MEYYVTPEFKFALREDLKDNKEFLPTKSEPNAAGWDVRAAFKDRQSVVLKPGQYVKVPTGIRMMAPSGWWLELRPRSSTFAKKNLHALYGVIDTNFESEILICLNYQPDSTNLSKDLKIEFGEPLGQLIPVRQKEMIVNEVTNEEYDALCKARNSVRGTKGFGEMGG